MSIWNQLPQPFFILAPMEGVTDMVFRQVIATAGRPDLFFTEFTNVSSFASPAGRANALERLQIAPTDPPIIAQIWGKNPDHFSELSSALSNLGFSGVDINMGCPDRHVNKAGGGIAMSRTPELAIECIKNAQSATSLPVSVKTRLGYSSVEEYQTWLPLLLKQNLTALTVHLRTKKEMSKVPAHFELIPEILNLRQTIAPETKIIFNGDLKNKAEAEDLYQKYPEIDGFMIGRGVFENPYCFTDHQPTREELLKLFHLHLDLFDANTVSRRCPRPTGSGLSDEPRNDGREEASTKNSIASNKSFEPLKHYFKIYINSFPGASELRSALMNTHSTAEARQVLKNFKI